MKRPVIDPNRYHPPSRRPHLVTSVYWRGVAAPDEWGSEGPELDETCLERLIRRAP